MHQHFPVVMAFKRQVFRCRKKTIIISVDCSIGPKKLHISFASQLYQSSSRSSYHPHMIRKFTLLEGRGGGAVRHGKEIELKPYKPVIVLLSSFFYIKNSVRNRRRDDNDEARRTEPQVPFLPPATASADFSRRGSRGHE